MNKTNVSYRLPLILLFLGIILSNPTNAQDTLRLDAVIINEIPWLASEAGTKVEVLDSTLINSTINSSLTALLNKMLPIYFKNNGISGLASINLRGTSANHTALMWNGFKLQLPTLQQIDYNLVPVIFWDGIGIQYGPSISLNGADVAGGAIHLLHDERYKKGLHVKYVMQVGSFGFHQQAFSTTIGGKHLMAKTQFNIKTADNDFEFTNYAGDRERQNNARVRQFNFLQHLNFYSKTVTWKNTLWVGNNHRQLPRTISGNKNEYTKDSQEDDFLRIHTSLNGNTGDLEWEASYALQQDKLLFESDAVDSENYSDQHSFRIQGKYGINKIIDLSTGAQSDLVTIDNSNYSADQQRLDYYLKADARIKKWWLHLGFKQIFISGFDNALMPSLGIKRKIFPSQKIILESSARISRHYRFPTANDLYWNPGGNLSLSPESGISTELTQKLISTGKSLFSGSATLFFLNVNDWILWMPQGPFWAPRNVRAVESKGIEATCTIALEVGNINIDQKINYSFTSSTNTADDKQLAYIPKHQASWSMAATINSFFAGSHINFTGKRFTTSENIEVNSLPSFLLTGISFGYNFENEIAKKMVLQAECNNFFNVNYQTLNNRAMPGRNFNLQLTIRL